MNAPNTPDDTRRGFALVLVLWVLMLAGVMALIQSESARTGARNTVARAEIAGLRWGAQAGLAVAVERIITARVSGQSMPGRIVCSFEDMPVLIDIEDEAGKIDLNVASPPTVAAVLAALGVDQTQAAAMAATLADFTDADGLTRVLGAEAAEYAAAGLERPPRNGPLLSLDELRRAMGWADIDPALLRKHMTTHSGQRTVDPSLASQTLRDALTALGVGETAYRPSQRSRFTISVSALGRDGAATHHFAVVEILPRRASGYRILEWTTMVGSGDRTATGQGSPNCELSSEDQTRT